MDGQIPSFQDVTINLGEMLTAIGAFAAADANSKGDAAVKLCGQLTQLASTFVAVYAQAAEHAHRVEERGFDLYYRSGKFLRVLTLGLAGRRQAQKASELAYTDMRRFVDSSISDANTMFTQAAQATLRTVAQLTNGRDEARQLLRRLATICVPKHADLFVQNVEQAAFGS